MRIGPDGQQTRPLVIHSGRNEFQVFLMLLSILSGVLLLVEASPDPDIQQVPMWAQYFWVVGLVSSALTNLFANFFPWRDIKNGLQLEIASCIGLVLTCIVYTLSLLGYVDNPSLSRFLALDLLAIVAFIRGFRLLGYVRDINRLRRLDKNARAAANKLTPNPED